MNSEIKYLEKFTGNQIKELTNCLQKNFSKSSKWEIGEVKIGEIIPLCKYVYSERLEFAKKSILECRKYDIPLFYPYTAHYCNGDKHIVVPPIIEVRRKSLYLGDGMHRIFSLLENEIKSAYVLFVHGCTLPLPGNPQVWSNVKKQNIQLPGHMNFENFLREGLTGYSKFCNSDVFWH